MGCSEFPLGWEIVGTEKAIFERRLRLKLNIAGAKFAGRENFFRLLAAVLREHQLLTQNVPARVALASAMG